MTTAARDKYIVACESMGISPISRAGRAKLNEMLKGSPSIFSESFRATGIGESDAWAAPKQYVRSIDFATWNANANDAMAHISCVNSQSFAPTDAVARSVAMTTFDDPAPHSIGEQIAAREVHTGNDAGRPVLNLGDLEIPLSEAAYSQDSIRTECVAVRSYIARLINDAVAERTEQAAQLVRNSCGSIVWRSDREKLVQQILGLK